MKHRAVGPRSGKGTGMSQETYRNIVAVRFWKCKAKDDGAIALAELLVLGQPGVSVVPRHHP